MTSQTRTLAFVQPTLGILGVSAIGAGWLGDAPARDKLSKTSLSGPQGVHGEAGRDG